MKTNYIGKIVGNRVLAICKNNKGEYIQVPHIDFLKGGDLVLVALAGSPKAPLKYLSSKEVACFVKGIGIDGSVLETPEEMRVRHEKEHAELLKDPDYRAMLEEIRKEIKR